jgi:hypothetical protein
LESVETTSRKDGSVYKKTRWIACFFIIIMSLMPVSSVAAATTPTSTLGFKIWPTVTINDVNKIWKVTFNSPILSTSVNANTLYVTDSKQKKITATLKLSSDNLSATILASGAYTAGDYYIYITNGIMSQTGASLGEAIVVPFTVDPLSGVRLEVTVTDDLKRIIPTDQFGTLTLVDSNDNSVGATFTNYDTGKFTFSIKESGDYWLKYVSISNNLMNTQAVKIPKITMPASGTTSTRTLNLVVPTEDGVAKSKSGSIGGSTVPDSWYAPSSMPVPIAINISNSTSAWTTTTDSYGNFKVYLPTGSYTLVVDGKAPEYKKHSYKLTVTAGQMSTPLETVDVAEPIDKLGLTFDSDSLLTDAGSGVLAYNVNTNLKAVKGSVDSDATVYVYDTQPTTPVLLKTVKPNSGGTFSVSFTTALTGKKLQIKVIDASGNTYTLDMPSAI